MIPVVEVPGEGTRPAAQRLVLTDKQRAAVEWGEGPLMVLAGAGTGKTTVVVERVRWLLETGGPETRASTAAGKPGETLQPENILVLTYNVRAAAQLTRRLEEALGVERASRLWVHNFHSFGNRLLTTHRAELGLREGGSVLDGIGQTLLLRELRPKLGHLLYYDLGAPNSTWTLARFADLISRAKDELVTPEEYAAYADARKQAFDFQFGMDAFDEAIEDFRRRKAEKRTRGIWDIAQLRTASADHPPGRPTDRPRRSPACRSSKTAPRPSTSSAPPTG